MTPLSTQLEELARTGTQEHWTIMRQTIYALDKSRTTNRFSCRMDGGWEENGVSYTTRAELDANTALIVLLHNHLDTIIQALKDKGL